MVAGGGNLTFDSATPLEPQPTPNTEPRKPSFLSTPLSGLCKDRELQTNMFRGTHSLPADHRAFASPSVGINHVRIITVLNPVEVQKTSLLHEKFAKYASSQFPFQVTKEPSLPATAILYASSPETYG